MSAINPFLQGIFARFQAVCLNGPVFASSLFALCCNGVVCLQPEVIGMEKFRDFTNDPRIMEPLEEFLRTVREVVQDPRSEEASPEEASPKWAQWYKGWW